MRLNDRVSYNQSLVKCDDDRGNQLHDDACLYLADKDRLAEIIKEIIDSDYFADVIPDVSNDFRLLTGIDGKPALSIKTSSGAVIHHVKELCIESADYPLNIKRRISFPMGTTKTIKGYADLYCEFDHSHTANIVSSGSPISVLCDCTSGVLFEVKCKKTHIAKIIQQLNTYRTYFGPNLTIVLASFFELNALEMSILQDHGVRHMLLSMSDVCRYVAAAADSDL